MLNYIYTYCLFTVFLHFRHQQDEGPRNKHQKIDDFVWYDGKAGYRDLPTFKGVHLAGRFESTLANQMSFG